MDHVTPCQMSEAESHACHVVRVTHGGLGNLDNRGGGDRGAVSLLHHHPRHPRHHHHHPVTTRAQTQSQMVVGAGQRVARVRVAEAQTPGHQPAGDTGETVGDISPLLTS